MSRDIRVDWIDPDPNQPRHHFDPQQLDELAQAMNQNGLIVPILVRMVGDRYVIIHGERRWRAAQLLGWRTIRAEVRDSVSDEEASWLALIENIQRADLTPVEEAEAYQRFLDRGLTQEALGKRLGKSQSTIAQKLRLLTLPPPVRHYLKCGALSEGHARQLLRLKKLYPEGLTTSFTPGSLDDTDTRQLKNDRTILLLFINSLRIEDQPLLHHLPENSRKQEVIFEACKAIQGYLTAVKYTPQLWALAAFWWATLATAMEWSVSYLNQVIDLWHERWLSAIAWWCIYRDPDLKPQGDGPRDRYYALLYWGYHSDLDHSGAMDHIEAGTLPRELILEALNYTTKTDGYKLPSNVQPHGSNYREFHELRELLEVAIIES